MNDETKKVEDRLRERLKELESRFETVKAKFNKHPTTENRRKVYATSSKVRSLKMLMQFEKNQREIHSRQFKNELSPEEFSKYWETRLYPKVLTRFISTAVKQTEKAVNRNRI